ncbi:MAG: Gx transporter family protein, partial [Anaerovoracaceae bacterium]
IVRIILNGLMFTGVFAMTYALAGGLLSLLTMCLLKKTGRFSMIGVSMAGGVAHNLGQLIIASLMVENIKMFLYFPVLLFSGLITGILIGTAASVLYSSIPDRLFRN